MDARTSEAGAPRTGRRTEVERTSDVDLVITRVFDGPARIVFAAWTTPDLLMRWWVPKSTDMTLVSCEVDARTGGKYRFVFRHPAAEQPIAFFGRYLDVQPPTRLSWTNEESEEGAITTVTFTEEGDQTVLVIHEVYPSKAALDENLEGMGNGYPEQFTQLDELLATLG